MNPPFNSTRATADQLERWAMWMLTNAHIGVMSYDEYSALQRILSQRLR